MVNLDRLVVVVVIFMANSVARQPIKIPAKTTTARNIITVPSYTAIITPLYLFALIRDSLT